VQIFNRDKALIGVDQRPRVKADLRGKVIDDRTKRLIDPDFPKAPPAIARCRKGHRQHVIRPGIWAGQNGQTGNQISQTVRYRGGETFVSGTSRRRIAQRGADRDFG
jgi:hypothetical protein